MSDVPSNSEIEINPTELFVGEVKRQLPLEEAIDSHNVGYTKNTASVFYPNKMSWEAEMQQVHDPLGFFNFLETGSKKYDLNDRTQSAKLLTETQDFLKQKGVNLLIIDDLEAGAKTPKIEIVNNGVKEEIYSVSLRGKLGAHYTKMHTGIPASRLSDPKGLNPELTVLYREIESDKSTEPRVLFVNSEINPLISLAVVAHELGHDIEEKEEVVDLNLSDGSALKVHPVSEVNATLYGLRASSILYSSTKAPKVIEYGATQAKRYNHVLGKED